MSQTNYFAWVKRGRGFFAFWFCCLRFFLLPCLLSLVSAGVFAAEVFIYSSQSTIRGLDLTQGTDRFLTSSPYAAGVNALAYNLRAGIVYYGDDTSVYRWNPADGNGPSAHILMNDFGAGPITAPITNINSTAGSYLDGKYYVGSESNTGYIQDLYELTMSIDGTQLVSVRALNILSACACSEQQLGGFGDVAAILEGGAVVLYGSSADLGGSTPGSQAGRWKFTPSSNSFEHLSTGSGGQMSSSPSGNLYSNVGNSVREVNKQTGAISGISLMTTSAAIYDFTGGYSLDFGDAPDSYGAAFHRLSGGASVYIGQLPPDNEAGSLNSSSGLGDGLGDDSSGSNDEDAVAAGLEISAAATSYSLDVSCSAGARVASWIDFNINGVFDSHERNANHPVSCVAGQANLHWTGLANAVAGNSYLRVRASSNASAASRPVGVASDGEVEDHRVVISGSSSSSSSCPIGSASHVYSAMDLPVNIGPNANTTAISSILVPDAGGVLDVNVLEIQGSHTYINDLQFNLRHSGTTRRLYGPSCGSQNDFSFGIDDSATGTPPCPPTDGNLYPSRQQLTNFNGQDASGNWQLIVRDRYNGDGGTLNHWKLELCLAGSAVVEQPDLILGKSADVQGRDVTLQMLLRNTGNVDLSAVTLEDDLDAVFGQTNYTLTASPVIISGPAGLSANPGFDGSADVQLLGGSANLSVGEELLIEFAVSVDTLTGSAVPGAYTNQALAAALSPSAVAVSDLSGSGLDIVLDTDTATAFQVDAGASLRGVVFLDSSAQASESHDGIRQPAEAGVAGRLVQVLDAAGNVLASSPSNASGEWRIDLAAGHLGQALNVVLQADTISRVVSESTIYSDGNVTDGQLTLNPNYGSVSSGIDFGVVQLPSLDADQSISVNPGNDIHLTHEFRASSHGVLNFSLNHLTVPENPAWTSALYRDHNCNGLVEAGDTAWLSSLGMLPGDVVCVLLGGQVPLDALNGDLASIQLGASFDLADISGTGHGLNFQLSNSDVLSVVSVGNGRLELAKTVRNVSLGGADVIANTALPGHILEYIIRYLNAGGGPLSDVLIEDAAPAFTSVQPGSASCVDTLPGLLCVPLESGNAISWTVTGSLAPGESGSVRYQVLID